MVKVQEVRGKFSITIPVEYIKKKKLVKGQEMLWSFDQDGNLVLMKVV